MTVSTERVQRIAQLHSRYDLRTRVMGLMIASMVPAIFWTVMIAGVGKLAGAVIHPSALVLLGAAFALLAAVACAPLILRK